MVIYLGTAGVPVPPSTLSTQKTVVVNYCKSVKQRLYCVADAQQKKLSSKRTSVNQPPQTASPNLPPSPVMVAS